MQPAQSLVPEDGERVFRDTGARLFNNGYQPAIFGALFTAVALAMLVAVSNDYCRHPERVHGPIWLFWVGLLVFAAMGVWACRSGVLRVLSARNQRIVLERDRFVWFDPMGRPRVTCPYDQILRVEEKQSSQWSSNRHGSMGHRCLVQTANGNVLFNDQIEHYDRLRDLFLSRATSEMQGGVFRYSAGVMALGFLFVVAVTGVLCTTFTSSFVRGEPIDINGKTQLIPIGLLIGLYAVSAVFWVVIGAAMLSAIFERIEVSAGRLRYTNRFGVRTVDVSLTMIEHGSFRRDASSGAGSFSYSVVTPQGAVGWSESIRGCTDLVNILKTASEASTLGQDIEQGPH